MHKNPSNIMINESDAARRQVSGPFLTRIQI
jgi:hypothetical protein